MRSIQDVVASLPNLYGDGKYYYTQLDAINNIPRSIGNKTNYDNEKFYLEIGKLKMYQFKDGYRTVVQLSKDMEIMSAIASGKGLFGDDMLCYLQDMFGFITNLSTKEILGRINEQTQAVFPDSEFEAVGIFCDAAKTILRDVYREYFPSLAHVPPMNKMVFNAVDDFYSRSTNYPKIAAKISGQKSPSVIYQIILGMCLAAMLCRPSTTVADVYGR